MSILPEKREIYLPPELWDKEQDFLKEQGFNEAIDLCQTAIDKALNEAADQVGGGIIRRNKRRRGMGKIKKLPSDERQNMINVCVKLIWDKVNELVDAVNDLRQRVEEAR